MCYVALNAIQIAFFTTTTTTVGFYSLEQAQSRLSDVGGLFESTGNIFLLLCLVDLGLGFLHVLNNHRTGHIIARGVTAGLGFILFVLAAVTYGWQEDILTRYYTSNYDTENATISIIRISCAFDILLWIASLAVTALSIHVFLVSQRNVRLQRVSFCLSTRPTVNKLCIELTCGFLLSRSLHCSSSVALYTFSATHGRLQEI